MKKYFFYQPDLPTSIICWSYSLIVLLISILLWLEITVFQIWTVLVFLLFLVVAGVQLFFRRVEITPTELILHTVIPQNTKRFALADIKDLQARRWLLSFATKYRRQQIIINPRDREKLYDILKK
ncbi:MAG: EbsA family protein [Liquorilactobacillus ghanensis]|uniref:EbsA family protein n=1 Tax=Liquorilactobacillus ghanensis TaxID=399370 RepID=UPI0039EB16A4